MSTHLNDTQVNDLVDETLDGAELQWALQHVAGCAACRGEVDALRAVLHRVAQLPRSIQPERDLRPRRAAQAQPHTLWRWRYPLAAAAVLLIAISSIITVLVVREDAPNPAIRTVQTDPAPAVDLVNLERRYSDELRDLERVLADNRAELSPETVQIMESSLQIIDDAIEDARRALQNDPNSAMLGELLRSAYQRKLDLLRQAARSSAAT